MSMRGDNIEEGEAGHYHELVTRDRPRRRRVGIVLGMCVVLLVARMPISTLLRGRVAIGGPVRDDVDDSIKQAKTSANLEHVQSYLLPSIVMMEEIEQQRLRADAKDFDESTRVTMQEKQQPLDRGEDTLRDPLSASIPPKLQDTAASLSLSASTSTSLSSSEKIVDEDPQLRKLCDPTVGQDIGYIDLEHHNASYFYWFFESRQDPAKDPLVLWLTGGPGCSGMVALFMENGPCKIVSDAELDPSARLFEDEQAEHAAKSKRSPQTRINPYSWNTAANIIYVDQPANVGLSYGQEVATDENRVQQHLYDFVQGFLDKHPNLRPNPFFVFGESYGGHFVPHLASYIASQNDLLPSEHRRDNPAAFSTKRINLKGIGIGNGLTSPSVQFASTVDHAYLNKYQALITSKESYEAYAGMAEGCLKNSNLCMDVENSVMKLAHAAELNPYDLRKPCSLSFKMRHPLCYDFSPVRNFLSDTDNKKTMGIRDHSGVWEICRTSVHARFRTSDWMMDDSVLVADLLEKGVAAVVYSGDADMVVNVRGSMNWTHELFWDGASNFKAAKISQYFLDGERVADYKSAKGLTFVSVHGAGHMVPMDQPEFSLIMLEEFIKSVMEEGQQSIFSQPQTVTKISTIRRNAMIQKK